MPFDHRDHYLLATDEPTKFIASEFKRVRDDRRGSLPWDIAALAIGLLLTLASNIDLQGLFGF